jgi:hypothetical protein
MNTMILPASLGISGVLLLLVSNNVYGITVNNTDFSVNVLDNWAYQDAATYSPLLGEPEDDAFLNLFPNEFSSVLINTSLENWTEAIQNKGGAYSEFASDPLFPYRNVPVESYSQYFLDLSPSKVISRENTTIDGEAAIKIHRTETGYTNTKILDYFLIHEGKPYYIQYTANVKDFQKYLPQFEQMVESFKFIDRK